MGGGGGKALFIYTGRLAASGTKLESRYRLDSYDMSDKCLTDMSTIGLRWYQTKLQREPLLESLMSGNVGRYHFWVAYNHRKGASAEQRKLDEPRFWKVPLSEGSNPREPNAFRAVCESNRPYEKVLLVSAQYVPMERWRLAMLLW